MWLNRLLYSSTGEPSLLQELWEYLEGKYFSVDAGRYEHIDLGTGTMFSLQTMVLGLSASWSRSSACGPKKPKPSTTWAL